MSGELKSLNVSFKILNAWSSNTWKDLQELGHAPTDLSGPQAATAKQLSDSGYTGPEYETAFRGDLSTQLGAVQTGLSLNTNKTPGAPAGTFVYGAAPLGSRYNILERNMIKCGIGPSANAFASVRAGAGFTIDETQGNVQANSNRGFLGSGATGRGQSGVFIPMHVSEVPANIDPQWSQNEANCYLTNNIWNIYDFSTNSIGLSTGRYIEGQGPAPLNSILSRAYLRQIGDKVQFNCDNSKAKVFRCDSSGNSIARDPINLSGKWFITADYGSYEFLYGTDNLYQGIADYEKYRPVAIGGGSESSSIFNVTQTPSVSTGFSLELKFKGKDSLNAYRNGYPTIEVIIGDPDVVSTTGKAGTSYAGLEKDVIQWAKVSIAMNRPAHIMFPARTTTGSRYLRYDNGTSYSTMQIISGKKSFRADASDAACSVKYELLGDIGGIEVGVGNSGVLNAVIAPQIASFSGGLGQYAQTNEVLNCWCGIQGYAEMTIENANGEFRFSPNCYMSWDPDALMFKHHNFDLSWSQTLEDLDYSSSIDAYAKPMARYGYQEGLLSASQEDQSIDRYPDIVVDPRMGSKPGFGSSVSTKNTNAGNVISLMTMSRAQMGASKTSNGGIWGELKDPQGGPLVNNIGAGSPEFIKTHSSLAIQNRNMYPSPILGEDKNYMANFSVPTCAVWAHLFCNSQLLTAWPRFDHKTWINLMKSKIKNGFDSIFESSQSQSLNKISEEVISYNVNSTLDEFIIKNTLSLTLINPNLESLQNIFQKTNVMDSSRIWINFDSSASSGDGTNRVKFQGIITNMTYTSVGSGIQIDITAQDPFSLMMSNLEYPQGHRVDGWPVHIAVPYLLMRTGLPYDISDFDLTDNGRVIYIGRYIMTDYRAASIAFTQGNLQSNLSKALGASVINKYPVFYYDHYSSSIKYKDLYSYKPSLSEWNRLVSSSNYSNFNLMNSTKNSKYMPYERGTFKLKINNNESFNQILFQSKDRFRNSPIVSSVPTWMTRVKSGYKNKKIYNFENTIASASELYDLSTDILKHKPHATPMSVDFSVLGLMNTSVNKQGGCGVIETKKIPNIEKSADFRTWLLRSTDVSWDAKSNQVTTSASYEVMLPSIMQLTSNALLTSK